MLLIMLSQLQTIDHVLKTMGPAGLLPQIVINAMLLRSYNKQYNDISAAITSMKTLILAVADPRTTFLRLQPSTTVVFLK